MGIGKRLKRHRIWIAIGLLILIGGTAYALTRDAGQSDQGPTYTTEIAERGTLALTVAGTGNVEVRDDCEVWATNGGTVARVYVEPGDEVEAGDPLWCLDHGDAAVDVAKAYASLRSAQQGVAQAESQLAKAENNLADLEERYEEQQEEEEEDEEDASTSSVQSSSSQASPSTSVTAMQAGGDTGGTDASAGSDTQAQAQDEEVTLSDIEEAELEVIAAEAQLSAAKSSRASAQTSYDRTVEKEADLNTTAPCDGVVWSVDVEPGDTVSSGGGGGASSAQTSGQTQTDSGSSAPVVVAREGELAVLLSVNEVDVPSLKAGQRAELAFDALPDLEMTGKVDEIARDGTVDQGVVTYDVWVSLDVENAKLKTGMSASANVVTAVERDVLLVPNAAVKTTDDEGEYVQVLARGAAEPRDVTVATGLKGPSQTVIDSGIEEGAVVVTKITQVEDGAEEEGGGGLRMPFMGGGPGGGGGP